MAKSRKIASKTSKPADKRAATAEVEVVEEKKGMGWEGGVALITFVVIVIAILCVDKDLSKFGQGTFF